MPNNKIKLNSLELLKSSINDSQQNLSKQLNFLHKDISHLIIDIDLPDLEITITSFIYKELNNSDLLKEIRIS